MCLQGRIKNDFIQNVSSRLGYPLLKSGEILDYSSVYKGSSKRQLQRDPYTMIPNCEYIEQSNRGTRWGGRMYGLCSLFQPIVTDHGLCQGFNSPSINNFLRPSYFQSALNYAYKDDIRNTSTFYPATAFSADTGLNFILDRQTLFRNFWRNAPRMSKGSFQISVSPQLSAMGFRTRQRMVPLGMHTQLLLTPVVLESNNLRSLSNETRKCLYSDEATDLTIFKNYSQSACQFECLVKHARSICQCTPWDFPFEDGIGISICNLYGYYCFEESLKNTTYLNKECHCLSDCNIVDYHIEQTSTPIDVVKECENYEVFSAYKCFRTINYLLSFSEGLHEYEKQVCPSQIWFFSCSGRAVAWA